jgi:DNA-binding NtrC family response regulator
VNTQKPHIILVDDEPGVLNALKLLLSALGFNVSDFIDPRTALEYLKNGGTGDVIVSDLRMPHLDGIEFLTSLGHEGITVPFVLMSAHATAEDIKRATDAGSRGFLSKPFTPDQFRAIVQPLLP